MADFDGFVTFVHTPDLDRAAQFYGDSLGLPRVLDEGPAKTYRVSNQGFLGVCIESDSPRRRVPEGVCLTLVTDDVDGVYRRLTERGVRKEGAPHALPQFGVYILLVKDPDGHTIEVQRFENPACKG
ncbi:MAG: glyoxalase [Rhodospirillaceae bacterium]|nr:glyoxalase [Rhodospirillaceae bacterium]|tara:strand:- start:99 stop:479 length:381 start_codon:yes stop_codon:yes gene_type:complete